MLKWNKILMDSADENGSPSGYGAETTTTATTTETTKTEGNTDDGTKGDTSSTGTQDKSTAVDDKSKQATGTEDVTGYDKSKEEDKSKVEEKPLELDLKGLEEASVKDIRDFAKEHGLTKEQAQAMVDKLKANEDAKAVAIQERSKQEQEVFKKWESELKADPEFGGENFANSIHSVNKLIREELPSIKNILTTSGKRLPPSIMKDLNKVAQKLYGETELVQGDRTQQKDAWNPLDFYNKK